MDTETVTGRHGRPAHHLLRPRGWAAKLARPAESYGLVLALIILAFLLTSSSLTNYWWNALLFLVEGFTLFFALRTSRASPLLVVPAAILLVLGTLFALLGIALPAARASLDAIRITTGVLLLITPVTIASRISRHTVVTAETVLGAICIYVLLGYCFASVYAFLNLIDPMPFFVGVPHTTRTDYLFFSYTTLTTVGYGNLVPAGTLGQTFAMLEALAGQIYLVLVVARLVSLWGQGNPHALDRQARHAPSQAPDPHDGSPTGVE